MQRRRWVVIGLAALVVSTTTTVHAGTTDPNAPRFTDGQWEGTLQYSGKLDNQYTSASASGNGAFTMAVAGGPADLQ